MMVSFPRFDRAFLTRLAEWFAVAVAIALPWSTTAVGLCIAGWLIALLPTLSVGAVRRELATAAGSLPILLWCLGALGMVWADVDWHERFAGLDSFHRLLAIPLLLAQFRRSGNGIWVVCGFFFSSMIVLIASFGMVLIFGQMRHGISGVPVHDTIFQGSEFLICGFGAVGYAAFSRKLAPWPKWVMIVVGMLFLANFGVATPSRIALFTAPLMLLLLGGRLFGWKGMVTACVLAVATGAAAWVVSPGLQGRIEDSINELQQYHLANKSTSIGEHLAFLEESWTIIKSAPVIGHGTGSMPAEFRRVTAGQTGVSGLATVNPHNQTFAVAIQLGIVGAVLLWAMWLAHLALFRDETATATATAWLGFVVVIENVISSIVHSHLFDFDNGWLYVFSVGVLGGTMLRNHADHPKNRNLRINILRLL
jgi:O-antigen ligase